MGVRVLQVGYHCLRTVIRSSLLVLGKRSPEKLNVSVWTGFVWFRIGTTGFTWSSAVPPITSPAVDEHRLCPSQRSLLNAFSNGGYERIGLVTTLYQVHKFLSVWMSSVRFCVPDETNQQRRAWRAQQTPPLVSKEPSREGQTCLRVRALSCIELQAACVAAE
jgi:hypothetical protein